MKHLSYIISALIILVAISSCTSPVQDDDETDINIGVVGLYPANNDNYSIVVTKSIEEPQGWDYIDSLLFITLDTSGQELEVNGMYFNNRPNIRNHYLTHDGNIMMFGNLNSESYTWYFSTYVFTPAGEIVWSMNMSNRTSGVAPANNSDFFVFGWEDSDGYYDNLTYSRLQSSGDTLWNKTIPGASNNVSISSGAPSSDDGCYAIGYMGVEDRGNDILTAKIDQNGNILWTGAYGGNRYDDAQFVTELSDGSVLIVGELNLYDSTNANWGLNSGQQIYLIKLSAEGEKLWTKALGNTLRETANAVIETDDGSLVICGTRDQSYAYLFDVTTGWISKLSSEGEELWLKEFESKLFLCVRETANGDLLVVTQNLRDDSWYYYDKDLDIMKFSSSGTLLWDKVLTP